MSDRAHHFLNEWFGGHIGPLPAGERLGASVRLAAHCRQDATAAGIPLHEIRDAVGGDLIRKIMQALDIAAPLNHEVPLVPESPVPVEKLEPDATVRPTDLAGRRWIPLRPFSAKERAPRERTSRISSPLWRRAPALVNRLKNLSYIED
jgi:hypothetical protein